MTAGNARVIEAIQDDGSLYELGWYLAWKPGAEEAVLDGKFTAAELRAIADYMTPKTGAA